MIDERERYERAFELFEMPEPAFERLERRRDRRRRNRRVAAGAVGLAVAVLVLGGLLRSLALDRPIPADRGAQREPVVAIPLDHAATQVVVGEGGVWVAGGEPGPVTRLDPATNEIVGRFPGEYCAGMAVGEGAVWVSGPGDEIVRIDPASNEVTTARRDARAADCGELSRAVFVEAGWVWMTGHFNTIERIDPRTYDVTTIDVPGEGTHDVAALDGMIWVDSWKEWEESPTSLVGIDPATGEVVSKIPIPVSEFTAGFGSLWWPRPTDGALSVDMGPPYNVEPGSVVEDIARIDPSTGSIIATVKLPLELPLDQGEVHVAIGEGAVWVSGGSHPNQVLRIDPATNEILGEVALETPARDIAAGEGAVWVTDGEGTLYRIDPDAVVGSS